MKQKVKEKQDANASLIGSRSDEEKEVNFVKYKDANKIAKKDVTIAKNNVYKRLYKKLETKEGDKDVFKLVKVIEKKTRELGHLRCIKGDEGKVLVEDAKIRERSLSYFSQLFIAS